MANKAAYSIASLAFAAVVGFGVCLIGFYESRWDQGRRESLALVAEAQLREVECRVARFEKLSADLARLATAAEDSPALETRLRQLLELFPEVHAIRAFSGSGQEILVPGDAPEPDGRKPSVRARTGSSDSGSEGTVFVPGNPPLLRIGAVHPAGNRPGGSTELFVSLDELAGPDCFATLSRAGIDYSLFRLGREGSVELFASGQRPASPSVEVSSSLPDPEWLLSVAPRQGWTASPWVPSAVFATFVIASLSTILVFHFSRLPTQLRREVLQATEKLSRRNVELKAQNAERERIRQQLQLALDETRRAKAQMAEILKSVADGLVVTDPEGRVLLLNERARCLLGLIGQTELGQPLVELGAEAGVDLTAFHRLDPATFHQLDLHRKGEAGDVLSILQARAAPIHRDDEIPVGRLILLQEVTKERELERMKDDFIATAAHELRTPLTAILGFAELLLQRAELPLYRQRQYLNYILEKTNNLNRVVGDMLDVSRLDSGLKHQLRLRPGSPENLFRGVLQHYRELPGVRQMRVEWEDSDVALSVDSGKMRQVMENLLSNAVKYSPDGACIRVWGRSEGRSYVLSVSDEGMGMTPYQVDRVFDKFYRADPLSSVEGTGLGMSIVKGIMEAHGGDVEVESLQGSGTRVHLYLPLP